MSPWFELNIRKLATAASLGIPGVSFGGSKLRPVHEHLELPAFPVCSCQEPYEVIVLGETVHQDG